ncbi:MAG: glycosyltransferase family 2 protein [Chthoniobacterales bacterium]|nr:glycosyltransferase family 2 protein [Chthoniobacterales bacterium]
MMPFGPKEEATPAATKLQAPVFLSLFVACYNEQDNIIGTLETLVGALQKTVPSFDIIIVDDASKDESVPRIRKFMADNSNLPIRLLLNGHNEGVATNYAEGAFRAKGEWYRMICGDNVEPAETLEAIFTSIGKAEVIVPYTVEIRGRSTFRRLLSKTYTALVNGISGYHMHYYNGLLVTRTDYVRRWHSNSHGFGFQADLLTRLLSKNLTYLEVAVYGNERATGESKALTMRNLASVAHSLQNVAIRRVSKALYGQC